MSCRFQYRAKAVRGRSGLKKVIIDGLNFHPMDGGFSSALLDMLRTVGSITDMEFFLLHDKQYDELFRGFDVESVGVRVPRRFRSFYGCFRFKHLSDHLNADAIHCEISSVPVGVDIPVSASVHDLFFLHQKARRGRMIRGAIDDFYWRSIYLPSLTRAKIVKCISERTREVFQSTVPFDGPVQVIYPRFPMPDKKPAPVDFPIPDAELKLLFLGSVVGRKNLPYLLEALAAVNRPWTLDIAGNLWEVDKQTRARLKDPRITVHGYVSEAVKQRLFDRSHIIALPSLEEGFGYPVAEAMLRGRAVLVSDIAVFREYVPAECRFDLENPRDLSAKLDGLDAVQYHRQISQCWDAVQIFDAERSIEAHREYFARLLN